MDEKIRLKKVKKFRDRARNKACATRSILLQFILHI